MATLIITGITTVPLFLLIWDLVARNRPRDDRFAGPARTPSA
jgi:hypothetical protein